MIQWEYKSEHFDIDRGGYLIKDLNKHGQCGWELVWVHDRIAYFKRLIEKASHAALCCCHDCLPR